MAIDVAQLKSNIETALTDIESVLNLVEDLPEPANVKNAIVRVDEVLRDVQAFLNA